MVKGMIDFALQSMMQFRKCFRKLNVLAPGRLNWRENLQLEVERARRLLQWSGHAGARACTPVAPAWSEGKGECERELAEESAVRLFLKELFSQCLILIFFKKNFLPLFLSLSFFFNYWGHTACGILVPRSGIEPLPPALEAQSLQSLNHWTTREVPQWDTLTNWCKEQRTEGRDRKHKCWVWGRKQEGWGCQYVT